MNIILKAINAGNAPPLDRLNRICYGHQDSQKINLQYEDGCSINMRAKWKRLFFHCMALNGGNDGESGKGNVKQESKNFRTDTLEPDPVTSVQISGQMIITGHATGYG